MSPRRAYRTLHSFRRIAALALYLCAAIAAAAAPERFVAGDPTARSPAAVSGGLLLIGGGARDADALRWFFAKAGHGHVVVLRASEGGEIGEEFHRRVGGIASAETFVFSARAQARDPAMLAALARADGIFIAGGDQARYVRFWKGTPVARALDAHVAAGKPLGGTSAGLAILGEQLYGAMDGGSLSSVDALANPFGPATTIVSDFLHVPLLRGVVTDTHFGARERLGRLFAFLAVAQRDRPADARPMCGLGIDEDAAVAVEPDGRAHVYAAAPDAGAWVVDGAALRMPRASNTLDGVRVAVTIAGRTSELRLPACTVERPLHVRTYEVERGRAAVVVDSPRS